MEEKVNYAGITSKLWENITPTQVSKGIKQYLLWQNEQKQVAIYTFEKDSKFHMVDSHDNYDEHIYVIDGVFGDGQKEYQKGEFIINPKGTAHIPQSKQGCTVLVTSP